MLLTFCSFETRRWMCVFMRIPWVETCYKELSLRRQMVFGVLLDQEAGKVFITFMKFLSIIQAFCKYRFALLLIPMLVGKLIMICYWRFPSISNFKIFIDQLQDWWSWISFSGLNFNKFCWIRLSSNGRRTWLVNLDSKNLKPVGWAKLAEEKPELLSFSDVSIYELHTRDFRLVQLGFSFSFKKKNVVSGT